MKKVKTILGSLFVMLASVLISACSCSGSDAPVSHVYVKDISIRCLEEQDDNKVTHSINENSGVINLTCHLYDTFRIEYTLSPSETTTTQVNWSYSVPDLVSEVDGRTYRANSAIEVVEFKAIRRSSNNKTTTITFSTFVAGEGNELLTKTAVCNVTIFDEVAKLPTLVKPEKVSLVEKETNAGVVNRIEWTEVNKVIPVGATEEQAVTGEMEGGHIKGLKGYELLLTDENGNVVSKDSSGNPGKTLIGPNFNCYPTDAMIATGDYVPIESGKKYNAVVTAVGDQGNAKTSAPNDELKFYKIESVSEFKNNNGKVTFLAPANSQQHDITYSSRFEPVTWSTGLSDGTLAVDFDCNSETYKAFSLYELSVLSHPRYSESEKVSEQGYAVYDDGYRYYPSAQSKVHTIQRLAAPKLSLAPTTMDMEIGGKTFEDVDASTNLILTVDASYDTKYNQTFEWEIQNQNSSNNSSIKDKSVISLNDKEPGSYIIKVKTVGNPDNTISSKEVKADLRVLPYFTKNTNLTLNGDILEYGYLSPSSPTIGGFDLFFIDKDATSGEKGNSKHVKIEQRQLTELSDGHYSFDISTIGLMFGTYSLYAKPIHYINSTTTESDGVIEYSAVNAIGKISLEELFKFSVIQNIDTTGVVINSDGTLIFDRVKDDNGEYFPEYKLSWRNYNKKSTSIDQIEGIGLVDFVLTNEETDIENNKFQYTIIGDGASVSIQIRDVLQGYVDNFNKQVNESQKISLDKLLLNDGINEVMEQQFFVTVVGRNPISTYTPHYISSKMAPEGGIKCILKPALDSFALADYNINFAYEGQEVNVVIELKVVDEDNSSATPTYYKTDEINCKKVNGGFSVNLYSADCDIIRNNINTNGLKNSLRVIICGKQANDATVGELDYKSNFVDYEITSQPNNVSIVDNDGEVSLSWDSINVGEEETKYSINYYEVTKVSDNESFSPLGSEYGIQELTYDVYTILKNNPGKVIAFEVVENNSGKLNGIASERVYASQLSKPVLSYGSVGGKESIVWKASGIDNVYEIYLDDTSKEGNWNSTSDGMYYYNVPGLQEGVYKIAVVAKYTADPSNQTTTAGSNFSNPLVVASEKSFIPVYVVSKAMDYTVINSGAAEVLAWLDICNITPSNTDSATYTLSQGTGENEKTYVVEGSLSVSISDLISAGFVFNGGANNIVITPSINFADVTIGEGESATTIPATGIILTGNVDTSVSALKWYQPTITGTSKGQLVVDLGEDNKSIIASAQNVVFDLYTYDGEDYSLIDANKFSVTKDAVNNTIYYIDVFGLDASVETSYNFAVKVRSSNVLTSDYSATKTATKIAQVQVGNQETDTGNFQKIGDVLQWAPISNATQYIISYKLAIEENYETIVVDVNGTEVTNATVDLNFRYENGRFVCDFDEKVFFNFGTEVDNIVSGDLNITIRALTSGIDGYLNSDVSDIYTITRLNNNGKWVTIEGGVIKFAPYSSTEEVVVPETPAPEGTDDDNTENQPAPIDDPENETTEGETTGGETTEDETIDSIGTNKPRGYRITISKIMMIETTPATTVEEGGEAGSGSTEQTPTQEEKVVAVYVQDSSTSYAIGNIDLNDIKAKAILSFAEYGKTYAVGNDVPFTADGKYVLTLQFLGNDNEIISSQEISVDLTKTAKTQLSTDEGKLQWTPVTDASYRLEISSGEGSGYAEVGKDSSIEVIGREYSTTDAEGNVITRTITAGQTYSIKVLAYVDGQLHSEWSDAFNIYVLKAPTGLALSTAQSSETIEIKTTVDDVETTQSVTYDVGSPIISWLSNNNIETTAGGAYPLNFELVYTDKDGKSTSVVIQNSKNLRAYIDNNLPAGTVAIKIRVIGNTCNDITKVGIITSQYSDVLNVTYVDEPSSVTINNGSITWANIDNGIKYYTVTAYDKVAYETYLTAYETYLTELEEYNTKLKEKAEAEDPDSVVVPNEPTEPKISAVFAQRVTTNSLDFTKVDYNNLSQAGGITLVVSATTDPSKNVIVSSQSTAVNSASLFKTPVVSEFGVKNGMLNWKLSVNDGTNGDIESFVNGFITPAIGQDGASESIVDADKALSDVIKYVYNKINLGSGKIGDTFATDATLEAQISYLLSIRMNYNNNVVIVVPSKVELLDADGKVTQALESAKTLEYYYNVVTEPEKANPETEQTPATVDESAGTNTTYEGGKYIISLSSVGNGDKLVPIVSSGYTGNLTAYKPESPETWGETSELTQSLIDIDNGFVQWKRPTTVEKDVTSGTLTNHTKFYISAKATNTSADSRAISTIVDTDKVGNGTASDYRVHLTNLFRPSSSSSVFSYQLTDSSIFNDGIYLNTVTFDVHTTVPSVDNKKYFNHYKIDYSTNIVTITYFDYNGQETTSSVQLNTEPGTYTTIDPLRRYIQIIYTVGSDGKITRGEFLNNSLLYNTSYQLSLYTMGTEFATISDSETQKVYLNSNTTFVTEEVCFLNAPTAISFAGSNMSWSSTDKATATQLYIYGPFDNMDDTGYYRNLAWAGLTTQGEANVKYVVDDTKLTALYNNKKNGGTLDYAGLGLTGKEKLQIIPLGAKDAMGTRDTSYTLTDNTNFGAGGYIVHFQHLGNGRGVIDSGVTAFNQIDQNDNVYYQTYEDAIINYANAQDTVGTYDFNALTDNGQKTYAVEKLTQNTQPQSTIEVNEEDTVISTGWVGNDDTVAYRWVADTGVVTNKTLAKDGWVEIDNDAVDQETGAFVWSPVYGANAYKVTLYQRISAQATTAEAKYTIYTRETRHSVIDEVIQNDQDITGNELYYLEIVPIRTEGGEILNPTDTTSGMPTLAMAMFNGDKEFTTEHIMLTIPNSLAIDSNGNITWNGPANIESPIKEHYIQINKTVDTDSLTTQMKPVSNPFNINDIDFLDSAVGKIGIQIKAIANNGTAEDNQDKITQGNRRLSSVYSIVSFVERISDPQVRLEKGVFNWITGTPATASELWINKSIESAPEVRNDDNVMMYTDITAHNSRYTSDGDLNEFPEDEYQFAVRYQGNIIPDEDRNDGYQTMTAGQTYIVASKIKTLKATKLSAPSTENDIILDDNGEDLNVVAWEPIPNAQGYRVRVFSKIDTIDEESGDVVRTEKMIEKEVGLTDLNSGNSTFFLSKNGKVYFLVDQVLGEGSDQFNIKVTGGSINIYVQALGSSDVPTYSEAEVQENEMYLASSYSTFTTIGVPPRPTFVADTAFDTNTATLTWAVGESDDTNAYNIKITSTYTVTGVSKTDFEGYWINSANRYMQKDGSETTNASLERTYPEIKDRAIVYEETTEDDESTENIDESVYSLTITDTIELLSKDYNNRTPLKYQFTNMGTYTSIKIVAMSFGSGASEDSEFVSMPTYLNGGNLSAQVSVFGKGDGSDIFPYEVDTYNEFNNIRAFNTRAFKLTGDISLTIKVNTETKVEPWTPISEFSGTIDGNNCSISNFTNITDDSDSNFINNTKYPEFAFIINNTGTIKNLTFVDPIIKMTGDVSPKLATIAIENYGIIDNVRVTGATISANLGGYPNGESATTVAGLVISNLIDDKTGNVGTITNSSVEASMTALDNTSMSTLASGIAINNQGTIEYTNFKGTIKANVIGGIVKENVGKVDRCSIDDATLTVTDKYSSESQTGTKISSLGGIINKIGGDDAILTNSYSKAKIVVERTGTSSSMLISGMVVSVAQGAVTISGNYIVFDVVKGGTNNPTSVNYMIPVPENQTGLTCENNFYVVVSGEGQITTPSADKGTQVVLSNEGKGELAQALINAGLGDVYDTSITPYPTLKPKTN